MSLLRGVSFEHLNTKRTRTRKLAGAFVRSPNEVSLVLNYAGEANTGWFNAFRKAHAACTATTSDRERFDMLMQPFAEYVVADWVNVIGEDGAPVKIYPAGVVELMTAYADQAFDLARGVLMYAMNVDNFREYSLPQVDAEALGKE